ncbi:MAG TPA: hypothetical protein VFI95_18880 [Terriglobales bacterium]|nr:hypothetical protein [Terriglobales bacterium]
MDQKRIKLRRSIVETAIILLVITWGMVSCFSMPEIVELPAGYSGWVVVKYEDPHCSRLQRRWFLRVIAIGPSGEACTSESAAQKWQYVRYQYRRPYGSLVTIRATGWGGGGSIWAGSYSNQKKVETFFVGSEEKLNASWASEPKL